MDSSTPSPSGPPPPPPLPSQLLQSGLPHDDRGPALNALNWTLTCLATGFLALRVYCKLSQRRRLWWDDYILIAAWACLVASTGTSSASVALGYGKHGYDLPLRSFGKLVVLSDVGGTFAILAAVWSKTSFAVTLLRITQGWPRLAVWLAIISMNVAMHLTALLVWVQCTPVERAWNPFVPGSCLPIDRLVEYNMFSAAYSAAMDVLLALLPWRIVWAAKLRPSESFGVAIAMSMGLFAGITAFIKVTQVPNMKSQDIYDGVPLSMWSTAEIAVTIMAASVPILRALLRDRTKSRPEAQWLPKYRASWTDNLELNTRSTVVIEAGHGDAQKGKDEGMGSLRRISTDDVPPPVSGAIVRTSIVTVVFEDPEKQRPAGMPTVSE